MNTYIISCHAELRHNDGRKVDVSKTSYSFHFYVNHGQIFDNEAANPIFKMLTSNVPRERDALIHAKIISAKTDIPDFTLWGDDSWLKAWGSISGVYMLGLSKCVRPIKEDEPILLSALLAELSAGSASLAAAPLGSDFHMLTCRSAKIMFGVQAGSGAAKPTHVKFSASGAAAGAGGAAAAAPPPPAAAAGAAGGGAGGGVSFPPPQALEYTVRLPTAGLPDTHVKFKSDM